MNESDHRGWSVRERTVNTHEHTQCTQIDIGYNAEDAGNMRVNTVQTL